MNMIIFNIIKIQQFKIIRYTISQNNGYKVDDYDVVCRCTFTMVDKYASVKYSLLKMSIINYTYDFMDAIAKEETRVDIQLEKK